MSVLDYAPAPLSVPQDLDEILIGRLANLLADYPEAFGRAASAASNYQTTLSAADWQELCEAASTLVHEFNVRIAQ